MAKSSIKIRAKKKGDVVTVKALIRHPMETGLRKDKKTGKNIPAHFIQNVTAKSGDKTLMEAQWGGAVSKNPYLSFKYKGEKGDALTISWTDNTGKSDSQDTTVK